LTIKKSPITSLFNCRLGGSLLWSVLLVLVTFIWGNSFIAIKHIVEYVSPLELVALRFVPVALTFALVLLPTTPDQTPQPPAFFLGCRALLGMALHGIRFSDLVQRARAHGGQPGGWLHLSRADVQRLLQSLAAGRADYVCLAAWDSGPYRRCLDGQSRLKQVGKQACPESRVLGRSKWTAE
jgi:hypothetical protein